MKMRTYDFRTAGDADAFYSRITRLGFTCCHPFQSERGWHVTSNW